MWTVFIQTLFLLLVTTTTTVAFGPSGRRVHPLCQQSQPRLRSTTPRSFPTFLSVEGSSSSSSSPSTSITNENEIITLQLTKPLGMILEEMEGASGGGVVVADVNDTGSAAPYATQIQQTQIVSINNVNVRSYNLEQMMSTIGALPADQVVTMEFQTPRAPWKAGTEVTISVVTSNGETMAIPAKVGDNLRQTLLLNKNIEVYQGMQKISNCGGAGQCTLCAFDFVTSEGWEERSDYESSRLKKFPTARLTCLNPIQGPATIRKTQR